MKQYNNETTTHPKTINYRPDLTPEATVHKRAEAVKAMGEIRSKHEASEALKGRAASSNQQRPKMKQGKGGQDGIWEGDETEEEDE